MFGRGYGEAGAAGQIGARAGKTPSAVLPSDKTAAVGRQSVRSAPAMDALAGGPTGRLEIVSKINNVITKRIGRIGERRIDSDKYRDDAVELESTKM